MRKIVKNSELSEKIVIKSDKYYCICIYYPTRGGNNEKIMKNNEKIMKNLKWKNSEKIFNEK